jgi:hypothetical protein
LIGVVGPRFGGAASWSVGLLLAAWGEFVMFGVQSGLTVIALVLPVIAPLAPGVMGFVLIWIVTHFHATANGFGNVLGVFFAVVGWVLLSGLVLVTVLTALGLAPPMPQP